MLDKLEVELLGRVVAKDCAFVREVELEEVRYSESLSEDALRSQSADLMVFGGMLSEESCSRTAGALACNLKLQNHLLLLMWPSKVE